MAKLIEALALVINDSDYDSEFPPFKKCFVHLHRNNQHLFIWELLSVDEYRKIYLKYIGNENIKIDLKMMYNGKAELKNLDNEFNVRWDETYREFLYDSPEKSKPECKKVSCELCNGIGVRDFQFYTRTCECRL